MSFNMEHSGTLADVHNAVDSSDIGKGYSGLGIIEAIHQLVDAMPSDGVKVIASGHEDDGTAWVTLTVQSLDMGGTRAPRPATGQATGAHAAGETAGETTTGGQPGV